MAAALAEDERVRSAREGWLVGRFLVPASRLAELGDLPLPLSIVLDGDLGPDPRVEAVELPHPGALGGLADLAPEVYVEVPADQAGEVPALGAHGLRAKVRCGGAVVPEIEALAELVRACREHGVVFKATAGLHHAVRTNGEHGFLNLLAAAVFGDEEDALDEGDGDAFSLTANAFGWRDRVATAESVHAVRAGLLTGFGSCSIAEPVEELRSLGILSA